MLTNIETQGNQEIPELHHIAAKISLQYKEHTVMNQVSQKLKLLCEGTWMVSYYIKSLTCPLMQEPFGLEGWTMQKSIYIMFKFNSNTPAPQPLFV